MKTDTLINKITNMQLIVWELADNFDPLDAKVKDRIFNSGIVLEESEFLKALSEERWENEVTLENYYNLLKEARKFYQKFAS